MPPQRDRTSSQSEAEFVQHIPCPCGKSSDACAVYSDGSAFCFSCNKPFKSLVDVDDLEENTQSTKTKNTDLLEGTYAALSSRRLTLQTCQRFSYSTSRMAGKAVQVANYYDPETGAVVAQKVRDADKNFKFIGEPKKAGLFGQQLWGASGKRVIITEGEIDAMSISQVMDHKWPVVSIKNGASGALKALSDQLQWLLKFSEIVLAFDNDDPGRKAMAECVSLFPPGRVSLIHWPEPYKDASDMLQAGDVKGLIQRIWQAEVYRPDGIVTLADIRETVLNGVAEGLPYCLPSLTKATYGRHMGECVGIGAGTGVGKSDFIAQQIAFDITELNEPVAAFMLEQSPTETIHRVAGKVAGKTFHLKDTGWEPEDLEATVGQLEKAATLYLYNHFGATDWDVIKERIRYLAHTAGVRLFYLDHLTALAAAEDDERVALERITHEISSLCQELGIWILFISHLATPEGKPHEEGGRVMIRHFKGSRAIGYWAHTLIGIERDQQNADEEARHTTFYRILKCRLNGSATGEVIPAKYDAQTGRLREASNAIEGDLAAF